MTQTNEWGVMTPDNEWGDAPADTSQWGADEDTDSQPQWGEDPEPVADQWGAPAEPAQEWDAATDDPPLWGDTASAEPAQDQWGGGKPDVGFEQPAGTYSWDEDAQDEDPLGRFDLEEPTRERKLSPKVLTIGGGGLLAVILAIAVVFGMLGGSDTAEEPEPTAETTEDTIPSELQQFEPFAKGLQDALNNRDAEAYRALFTEESHEFITLEDTQAAIEALAPGAQYEVELVNGSAAGPTATVKLNLIRTLAGDTTEQPMTSQLRKEGEDWKMVITADDQ